MSTASKCSNCQFQQEVEILPITTNQDIKFRIGTYRPNVDERVNKTISHIVVREPETAFDAAQLLTLWYEKLINSEFDSDYYLIIKYDYLITELMNNDLFAQENDELLHQEYISNIHKILIIYIAYFVKNELETKMNIWLNVLLHTIFLIKEIDERNSFNYYAYRDLYKYRTLLIDLFYKLNFKYLDFDRDLMIDYIDHLFDLLKRKYKLIHDFNICTNEIKLYKLIILIRLKNSIKVDDSNKLNLFNQFVQVINIKINEFDVNTLLYLNEVIQDKFINIYEFIDDYNRLLILGDQFNVNDLMIEHHLTIPELNEFFELINLILPQIDNLKPNENKDEEYHKFKLNPNLYNISNEFNETITLIKEIKSLLN
jgi:hypothetical protein